MLQVLAFKCGKCGRLSELASEIEQCESNHVFEKQIREDVLSRLNHYSNKKVSWRYEGQHPLSIVLTAVSAAKISRLWFVADMCHIEVELELVNQPCSFKLEGTVLEMFNIFDQLDKGAIVNGLNSEKMRLVDH